MSEIIAETQWQGGLAGKPRHVLEAEDSEPLDQVGFVNAAVSTFERDFAAVPEQGSEEYDAVEKAAAAVMDEWRERGPVTLNRRTAQKLAAAVGNRLHRDNWGGGLDPEGKGLVSRPTGGRVGSLAGDLRAAQKEMSIAW